MTSVSQSKKPVYRRVSPTFWTGETGKAIRARGSEAILVAGFLMTSPSANMIGLYHQPVMFMGYYTALGIEGAAKGLQACQDVGFCAYDADAEMVWVFEMAKWQIEEALSQGDKRCKGVQREYDQVPNNRFLGAFFDRYAVAFHLTERRSGAAETGQGGLFGLQFGEAPSKPGTGTGTGAGAGTAAGTGPGAGEGQHVGPAARLPKAARPAPAAPAPAPAKGTRLTAEWKLPKPWGEWALDEFSQWGADKVRLEAEKFRDHWVGKSGKDATKVDWLATWRNWCRSDIAHRDDPKPAAPAPTADDRAARHAEVRAALGFPDPTNEEIIDAPR